ncbi:MAG: hypothetical protein ACRD0Z_15370 [Acidimicrobiales bacterium]
MSDEAAAEAVPLRRQRLIRTGVAATCDVEAMTGQVQQRLIRLVLQTPRQS